jgi:hypothetical protein
MWNNYKRVLTVRDASQIGMLIEEPLIISLLTKELGMFHGIMYNIYVENVLRDPKVNIAPQYKYQQHRYLFRNALSNYLRPSSQNIEILNQNMGKLRNEILRLVWRKAMEVTISEIGSWQMTQEVPASFLSFFVTNLS